MNFIFFKILCNCKHCVQRKKEVKKNKEFTQNKSVINVRFSHGILFTKSNDFVQDDSQGEEGRKVFPENKKEFNFVRSNQKGKRWEEKKKIESFDQKKKTKLNFDRKKKNCHC